MGDVVGPVAAVTGPAGAGRCGGCLCGLDEGWGHEVVDAVDAVEAVAGLSGPASAFDLELLDLVDPGDLPDDAARLVFAAAVDRVVGLARSLPARALTALAGQSPSGSYLAEVAVEHEVAVARRTSR